MSSREQIHTFFKLSLGLKCQLQVFLLIEVLKIVCGVCILMLKPSRDKYALKVKSFVRATQSIGIYSRYTSNSCYYSYQRSCHANEANGSFPIVLTP